MAAENQAEGKGAGAQGFPPRGLGQSPGRAPVPCKALVLTRNPEFPTNQVFVYDVSNPSPTWVKTVNLLNCSGPGNNKNYFCDALEYFLDPNNSNQPTLVGNLQDSRFAFNNVEQWSRITGTRVAI